MRLKKNRGIVVNSDTAIFCYVDLQTGEVKFGKYRNCSKAQAARNRFLKFMQDKFPGLRYINFYDTANRNFLYRWTKE